MSVTKEKNLEAMKSLILENKDFGVKEIVNILNNLGFRKDNGLPWQYSSLYSFICTHLKDFKHDIKTRIIKDLNELELDITNTSIIKDSKEIYQENLLAINKVILNNQDKTLSEIAGILNTFGYKTKRGVDWDLNKVNYHMIAILQLTPRKEAGTAIKESYENYDSIFKIISECRNLTYPRIAKILNEYNLKTKRGNSWNDQSVRKFLRDELKINKSPDMLRFQENIMNQLEKVEPKVIPQPEPEIETEIEVIPKYEITELVVKNNNGKFVTDSLKIASIFKRDHKNVLRDIKELNCSEKFSLLNFEQSEYLNDRGRKYPLFILSKDGFTKLVFGWKDDKSAEFQEMYIEQFNKMEQALKEQYKKPIKRELTTMELMALTLKGFEEQEINVLNQIKQESDSIKFETYQALENQKEVLDEKIKELDKKVSDMQNTQPSNLPLFNIESKGLLKTKGTFKGNIPFQKEKNLITDLVMEYKTLRNINTGTAWNDLYDTYRQNTNPPVDLKEAKELYNETKTGNQRFTSTIAYAQQFGYCPQLLVTINKMVFNLKEVLK